MSLARPLELTPETYTSVTIGFQIDETFKKTVLFCDDPAIPYAEINETCERCGLSEAACQDRAVPATIHNRESQLATRNQVLNQLVDSLQS